MSICALLVSFCHALGMDRATVEEAGLGGLLHDVGKMQVPSEILNKPGKLTDDEFTVMKSHASMSMELLTGVPGVSNMVIQIAGEHHEKIGGGGYPRGLVGEQRLMHGLHQGAGLGRIQLLAHANVQEQAIHHVRGITQDPLGRG